jgi:hypothetical protein
VVQGEADYAKIFRGKNHDSDFLKDNRRGEVSRFRSNANKGEAFDLSGGGGYQIRWCFEDITLTPLAGYSYHEQHLRMFDGKVSVFNSRSVHAVLHNLHSNYRTRWYGPWIGAEASYDFDCDFEFYGSLQYHWLQYHAKGHWNLREEFYDDFQHRANGYGILGTLGGTFQFSDCWKGGVRVLYLDFRARHGRDRTFLEEEASDSEGSGTYKVKIVAETRLNEVNWHSFRLEADLAYEF